MSAGIVALLLGLFIVPVVLLWAGHRVRKLPRRARRAFWGAVTGHCVAALLAVSLGMVPPEAWTDGETLRGFFGLWALLALPALGALGAALTTPDR